MELFIQFTDMVAILILLELTLQCRRVRTSKKSILVAILILLELTLQSYKCRLFWIRNDVAILILLELTLQCFLKVRTVKFQEGRNPYFIGINSAIKNFLHELREVKTVAILILLELTLQYTLYQYVK